ncbi:hypothetical protein Tco_0770294 [Tanacetum coccineum]|uniref:Zinc finger, GRF-type n=1 Tax=Tanacetum coccineum TaxID=301880 RepID=A0ABQ4ZBU6_9ASTR
MAARCACGLEAMIMTSWTNQNPGRRFYGFPTLSLTCVNFLRWYDPPMCQRSVQIIPGLLRSRNKLEEILAMVEEKRRKLLKFLIIGWVVLGFMFTVQCECLGKLLFLLDILSRIDDLLNSSYSMASSSSHVFYLSFKDSRVIQSVRLCTLHIFDVLTFSHLVSVGNLDDDLSISSSLHNLTEDDSDELSAVTALP